MAAVVLPPWLEWASSMMMAKCRPRCSLPISSRMNGNFCTVEMMIFLPLSMNCRRSPEPSAEEEDETTEDKINRLMEAKKMLPNASYFASTVLVSL